MDETQPSPDDAGNGGSEPNEYRSPGSTKLGPFVITAKFSIVLIFFIVIVINLLLLLGVVLAAMHRAGRL